jgi:hypothetical protein
LILVGRNLTVGSASRVWIWDISTEPNIKNTTPIVIDLSSPIFRPSNAFVFDATTIVLIDYRNFLKIENITGTPTFTYRSVPSNINMVDSAHYAIHDGHLYFLAQVTGNTDSFLYDIDITALTLTKRSSAFPGTVYGPRGINVVNDTLYLGGAISYTEFEGETSPIWIEKLIL